MHKYTFYMLEKLVYYSSLEYWKSYEPVLLNVPFIDLPIYHFLLLDQISNRNVVQSTYVILKFTVYTWKK